MIIVIEKRYPLGSSRAVVGTANSK